MDERGRVPQKSQQKVSKQWKVLICQMIQVASGYDEATEVAERNVETI